MKVVLAPDSFKNCLKSSEVIGYLTQGIESVIPHAEVIKVPMADGGEGTVDAVISQGGWQKFYTTVTGPLGELVEAAYAISDDGNLALIEMAAASGIELIERSQLNALQTTSFGTGELIRAVLQKGVKEIIIGVGGSACVDGGTGMVQALGVEFFAKDKKLIKVPMCGELLASIYAIDSSKLDERLKNCTIKVASDVTNPLLGEKGSATVFAPQKGASIQDVITLERGLKNYQTILFSDSKIWSLSKLKNKDLCLSQQGDGAGGGVGFALRVFCNAKIYSGAKLIGELVRLEQKLKGADLLITGERCTDSQTADGKLCNIVAALAKKHHVPAILISGSFKGNITQLAKEFAAVFCTSTGPCSLEEAIKNTPDSLIRHGKNIATLYSLSFG